MRYYQDALWLTNRQEHSNNNFPNQEFSIRQEKRVATRLSRKRP